jgi:hypothetical protein
MELNIKISELKVQLQKREERNTISIPDQDEVDAIPASGLGAGMEIPIGSKYRRLDI